MFMICARFVVDLGPSAMRQEAAKISTLAGGDLAWMRSGLGPGISYPGRGGGIPGDQSAAREFFFATFFRKPIDIYPRGIV